MTPDSSEPSDRSRFSTLDWVLIVIVFLTLAGTCLLVSAGPGTKEGHRPWSPNSVLWVITDLMAFGNRCPTPRSVEVKWLAHGLGAAAVLCAAAIAWFVRGRRDENAEPDAVGPEQASAPMKRGGLRTDITPATGAQLSLGLFVGWALLSAAWAPWPAVAIGEGLRFLMWVVWAIVLGRSLGLAAARAATLVMTGMLVITAIIGVWYFYERNPFLRLEFPIGNPLFTAACLLPGLSLAGALLIGTAAEVLDRTRTRSSPVPGAPTNVLKAMGGWPLVLGALIGLVAMVWAFWLSESRGPSYALVLGVAAAVWIVAPRSVRWAVPVIIVAMMVVPLATKWKTITAVEESGRGATIRFRTYAWRYAADLFLDRPIWGHGQGAYALRAQSMQQEDMERDPAAFTTGIIGHAHNEYLEVLAELGIVGGLLFVTPLVMTVWAAASAWRRATSPLDQWCLVGLVTGFVAMACEELADVALRKPGLPVFFYTTMGLIWAFSSQVTRSSDAVVRPRPQAVRVTGLIAGILAAAGITSVAWRDWEGALADYQVGALADKGQWIQALVAAEVATDRRLAVDDWFGSFSRKTFTGLRAASDQYEQTARMVARHDNRRTTDADRPEDGGGKPPGIDSQPRIPPGVVQQAGEDSQVFAFYASACERAGSTLLERMPGFPQVASVLADMLLLRQEMERLEKRLGLRQTVQDYSEAARVLLGLENSRDPQDLAVGLRLFWLSGKEPVAYRLDLLRKPLRRGPSQLNPPNQLVLDLMSEIEGPLISIMQEGGFQGPLAELLQKADAAWSAPDPSAWPDFYAPESYRLAARIKKLSASPDQAAMLAERAAELSKRIRASFPATVANARLDQAKYLLLAYPAEAGRAVAACQEAIEEWPKVRNREAQLRPVWQTLSVYMLAAGNEGNTRATLRSIYPQVSAEELDRRVGAGYAELCQLFMPVPVQARPLSFSQWLEKALALLPGSPPVHVLAAQVASERKDQPAVIEQLRTAADLAFGQRDERAAFQYLGMLANELGEQNQNRFLEIVRSLRQKYPTSEVLRHLSEAGSTQPATTPATQPGTAPAASGPTTVPPALLPGR